MAARQLYPRPRDLETEPVKLESKGFPKVFWLYLVAVALIAFSMAAQLASVPLLLLVRKSLAARLARSLERKKMLQKKPFHSILIAFDGSASSRKALDVALGMAHVLGVELSLLSVEENIPHFPADIGEVKDEKQIMNEYFARIQREAREAAKLRGLDFERADILAGHAAQSIINHARAIQCDLIVMGHSGRSGVWATLLGSTAERVSQHAHCTVMIVR